MPDDGGAAARRFHDETKHSVESLNREPHRLDWANLPLPFKIYRSIAGEPLPLPGEIRASVFDAIHGRVPERPAGVAFDRAALARMLHFSLGILHRRRLADGSTRDFRAAPATGALYHIDAYLVVADLADLAAGVYHFAPHDFSLRRLREGDFRAVVAEAAARRARVAESYATIVLASTFWRNAWKYRRRAYRHVFWDGGTVIAQLVAAAAADGWPSEVLLGFADVPIEELCGLDPEREGIVALIPVGPGAPSPPPVARPAAIRFEIERLSEREVDYPDIRAVHRAGVLDDGRAAAAWIAKAARFAAGEPAVAIELAGDRPDDSLGAVVERRGSTRVFDLSPISSGELGNVLSATIAPLAADYRASPIDALVELYVIVHAVEGVDPGAYRWDARRAVLDRLWSGERRREAGYLALGQALGAAAAVDVYAIADLDRVLAALGTRGYRAATLDGGISGGRTYLAAYAQRLGATGLTFFDDDVARFFGLDPSRFGVMFLTAVGHPMQRRASGGQ